MIVAKIIQKRKEKFVEILKTGQSVDFDDRKDWIFVREIDKIDRKKDVWWVHPTEVDFIWVRSFII